MKRLKQSYRKHLDQFFEHSRNLSAVDVDPALERLLERRADNLEGVFEGLEGSAHSIRMKSPLLAKGWLWIATASAVMVLAAIWIGLGWQARRVYARLDTADGSLSRVAEGRVIPLQAGERIEVQEIVRAGSEGSTLVLADGSRVEMRAQSELLLERADDGMRIRLIRGDVIVNAAKQHGHLYVQTRDFQVSVVGTVFLVKADDKGSRVAVIEGEVRVQQGTVEKSLRPGEQLASNPKSENLQFFLETGWSREAFAYLSKLHESMAQSLAARQSAGRTPTVSDKAKFEEASIRPCEQDIQAPAGARGGGSDSIRISPGRVDALCMTLPTLIRTAHRSLNNNPMFVLDTLQMNSTYGLGPEDGTRVRGGPDWVRSEKYTIAAVGDSTDAPTLQGPMLLDLLERRFKLKLRVETEETSVYALSIAKGGLKLKPVELGPEWYARIRAIAGPPDAPRQAPPDPKVLEELHKLWALLGCSQLPEADQDDKAARIRFQEAVRRGEQPPGCGSGVYSLGPNAVLSIGGGRLSELVGSLSREARRSLVDTLNGLLVVDKTSLPNTDCFTAPVPTGTPCAPLFNIRLEYAADEIYFTKIRPPGVTLSDLGLDMSLPKAPNIFDALEKLGLHLEKSKAPREFIVIEHIERPSPN